MTKDRIIEATFLLSLEFVYDNVSLKMIEEKSDAGPSSVYYHYKNKDDILEHVIQKYLIGPGSIKEEKIKQFKGSIIERLRTLYYYLAGVDFKTKKSIPLSGNDIDYKEYYLMFFSIYHNHPKFRPLISEYLEESVAFFKELIDESVKKDEVIIDPNSSDLAIFIVANIYGFLDLWVRVPNYSLDDLIESQIRIMENIIQTK
jgi:AcrR family transcriptional regulator